MRCSRSHCVAAAAYMLRRNKATRQYRACNIVLHGEFPAITVASGITNAVCEYLDVLSFKISNWIRESAAHVDGTHRRHVLCNDLIPQTDAIIVLQTNTNAVTVILIEALHVLNNLIYLMAGIVEL